MATTSLSSDPYRILGVEPDADSATIKKAYRKLVLSCHPDKVTDESLKAQKQEEFHQIQQAYETVGDEDNRTKYELELKAKKLREERDRVPPRGSPAQARNVHIYTAANPPPEYRSSSSKYSSKPPPKPYSSDYSRSWEHAIPTRSKTYEEVRKTRRSTSDEKLKRDREDSRERKRREREDERERERRRQDEDRRRRRDKDQREKELKERERERIRRDNARAKKEQEDREAREARARAERKVARERAERERERELRERELRDRELKRRQDSEEKLRAKATKPYMEPNSEDDNEPRRPRKPTRKDSSPREKSASKPRERASTRDEPVPDLPTADKIASSLSFAASYIKNKSPVKQNAETPFSAEYPDPNTTWKAKYAKAEPIHHVDVDGPPSPTAPPRLQKSHTMPTDVPQVRVPLGRSQTMEPSYFRAATAEKHRPSRERTSIDDDDYYLRPRVQKYKVGNDKGTPRTFDAGDYDHPYSRGPGATFPKLKTSATYGMENLSTSKPYGREELQTSKYASPSYSDYQTAYVAAPT